MKTPPVSPESGPHRISLSKLATIFATIFGLAFGLCGVSATMLMWRNEQIATFFIFTAIVIEVISLLCLIVIAIIVIVRALQGDY